VAQEEEIVEPEQDAGKEARSIQRGAAAASRRAQQRRQEVRVLSNLMEGFEKSKHSIQRGAAAAARRAQ